MTATGIFESGTTETWTNQQPQRARNPISSSRLRKPEGLLRAFVPLLYSPAIAITAWRSLNAQLATLALQRNATDTGTLGIGRDTFGLRVSGGMLTPLISFAPAPATTGNLETH